MPKFDSYAEAKAALAEFVSALETEANKPPPPATEIIGPTDEEARYVRTKLGLELLEQARVLADIQYAKDGGHRYLVGSFDQIFTALCVAELSGRLSDLQGEIWSAAQDFEEEDEEEDDEDDEEEA